MNTSQKIVALLDIIHDARALIEQIQNECTHESGEYHYDASTGHLCEADDKYWRVNICDDCGLRWRVDATIRGIHNPMYSENRGPSWRKIK